MSVKDLEKKPRAYTLPKLKLASAELLSSALPALAFGLLLAIIFGAYDGKTAISYMLSSIYGTRLEAIGDINFITALIVFMPPFLQLVLLGDRIPREVSQGVYSLTRARGRERWLLAKLVKVCLLSLLMSFLMPFAQFAYARVNGVGSDPFVLRSFIELMATWGLCQCALVVFSNVLGLFIKPLYMLFISLFMYALGLVLMLTEAKLANLFPTVQGMLYAHNSIFGKTDEGFFTPLFSAGYLAAFIAAFGVLGILRIRRTDLL